MKVTRSQILIRGLSNCCPNCGGHTLFRTGKLFKMNDQCLTCGFKFQGAGDEGFYLRATSLNFGVTVTCYLFPLLLLASYTRMQALTAEVLAVAGALAIPVLIYRPSRSWSLMNFYIFSPEDLPANAGVDDAKGKP